jgi:hypothetical protein
MSKNPQSDWLLEMGRRWFSHSTEKMVEGQMTVQQEGGDGTNPVTAILAVSDDDILINDALSGRGRQG